MIYTLPNSWHITLVHIRLLSSQAFYGIWNIGYYCNNITNQIPESQKGRENTRAQRTGELQVVSCALESSSLSVHYYNITLEFGEGKEMIWVRKESEGQGKDLKGDKRLQGKIALHCQEKCELGNKYNGQFH